MKLSCSDLDISWIFTTGPGQQKIPCSDYIHVRDFCAGQLGGVVYRSYKLVMGFVASFLHRSVRELMASED